MSAESSKSFADIHSDYEFFERHSTEAEQDMLGYQELLPGSLRSAQQVRFLDFGSGPGVFTERFLQRFAWCAADLSIAVIEPDDVYRRSALQRLAKYTTTTPRAWPFLSDAPSEMFDVILSNHVLYYVVDLKPAVLGLLDRIAPGGVLLTSIADRNNALIQMWLPFFEKLNMPLPHHSAEDVEAVLQAGGRQYTRRETHYRLTFEDLEENRWKILRFLLNKYIGMLPKQDVLALFDPYSSDGMITMETFDVQIACGG